MSSRPTTTTSTSSSSSSAAASSNSSWQQQVRALLESGDTRQKLEAYALLSAKCCETKELQNSVGALLREKQSQRLLDAVFEDIQATDKTIRLAATRLICQVAYENLLNQDSIVQLANGFSLGWIHVFSVPQSFQAQYARDYVTSTRPQTTRGFREFLKSTVVNSYTRIYNHVSSYYGGGCHSFLPLSWQFPDVNAQQEGIPDPASHLIGFYLVPRQAQFPEQDDFYSDELLGVMDADDINRIQKIHRSFMAVAAQRSDGKVLKSVLSRAFNSEGDKQWVLGVDAHAHAKSDTNAKGDAVGGVSQSIESIFQYFVREKTTRDSGEHVAPAITAADGDDPSLMDWNEVLVYCCMKINAEKLLAAFGVETFALLVEMFRQLSLNTVSADNEASPLSRAVCSGTYVWEAVLVGVIQNHPKLPEALKRHVAGFRRGLYQRGDLRPSALQRLACEDESHLREPWRHLLLLRLDQIQPLSWCIFLTQWRVAADTCQVLDNPQRRATTVCSVSSIRRSMVSMDPRSFESLDELRQELPNIYRSQRDITERESTIPEASTEEDVDFESNFIGNRQVDWRIRQLYGNDACSPTSQTETSNAQNGSLAHYLKLFHKMQQSPSNLDRLSLQQLQEKQTAASKLQESVAINKKRLADEVKRKRLELEARLQEEEEKLEELERKKAEARSSIHQKQTSRRNLAMRRRQQQQAQDEAKQQALMAQIELEQLEFRRLMEAKQLQQAKKRVPQEEPIAPPSRPRSASASFSHRPGSKRPLSARNPSTAAAATPAVSPPELLRQRAQIYGDVVSKIYLAEASRRPQPPLAANLSSMQSPHLVRRFSNFRKQNAVANSNVDSGQQQDQQQQTAHSEKREWKFHSSTINNNTNNQHSTSVLARDEEQGALKADGISSACTTLVMRNAALAVSERINIPTIPTPAVAEPHVPAYVIEAQYSALDTHHKQKFRERFNLKSISHRLSYTVLKQFTKIVRRDTAWENFHEAAARSNGGRPSEKIRHADFILVAQQLGISLSAKKLLLVARRLDEKKNGFVDWESFYAWWSAQYEDAFVPSRSS